ncbi:archease [Candidatus Woesearchaeota archaeon]|nr:archease [Candidatus Woesearchaeota archaeon]
MADMGFRFIKGITSDISWEAYGSDLGSLFSNSARALFSVICRIDEVRPAKEKIISATAENLSELMVNWLQELIASVDIDGMFYSEFKIKEISEKRIVALCRGEPVTPEKGETVVKAVTYHDFFLKKTDAGYVARVVVDI